MTARLAIRHLLSVVLIGVCATVCAPVRAQTEDDSSAEAADIDELEERFLLNRFRASPPPGEGFFGHYTGMDRAFASPDGGDDADLPARFDDTAWHSEAGTQTNALPEGLSFDPARVTQLAYGLLTVEHAELLEFLEFYNTEGRSRAARWFAASEPWRAMIERVAAEVGAPAELVWVAAIESSFDATATSRVNARGMWQFMNASGRGRGLRIDRYVDERLDPELATRAGLLYLLDLYAMYRSWPLALAAYNAGPGHVRGEIRTHDVTDFWAMDTYGCVYDASRRYALRAMTLALIDRNRSVFGFAPEVTAPEPAYAWVDIPGSTRLSLVAEAVDMSLGELRDLNPALLRATTPPSEVWRLRIPAEAEAGFVEAFDRVSRRWGTEHSEVLVYFGETMDDVAEAVGVPSRVLRQVNDMSASEEPQYLSTLLVPGADRVREPAQPRPLTEESVVLPESQWMVGDARQIFYRANAPDRLVEIAEHFGVSVFELAAWNDLDPDAVVFGDQLLVLWVAPGRTFPDTVYYTGDVEVIVAGSAEHIALQQAEEQRNASSVRRHTVRSGETLSAIARRYGRSVADILRWNDLDEDSMIRPGQRLVIR